ncbi:hypothetical protein [Bacillus cereus]|uniref:Uncharacterized protein n=1 Tax=Bacillus cereus (strain VD146) TaxID=1053236 RepID=R8NH83_BACCX|nr:hypothetical protein [Bacillus cereus]EOP45861.1 hypothetical protein IK1_04347 [Bacillus cereus VD146]
MKQKDIIIYGCVIIGAGIGLIMDNAFPGVLIGLGINAFPGVLIGLGIGYVLQNFFRKEE